MLLDGVQFYWMLLGVMLLSVVGVLLNVVALMGVMDIVGCC